MMRASLRDDLSVNPFAFEDDLRAAEDGLSKPDLVRVSRDLDIHRAELDAAVNRFRTALCKLLSARLFERFEEHYEEMRESIACGLIGHG